MNIIKSNGMLIVFPLMWFIVATRDVIKGNPSDAVWEIALGIAMLLIPVFLNRWMRDKETQDQFHEMAKATDNLKHDVLKALEPIILPIVDFLAAVIDRVVRWWERVK